MLELYEGKLSRTVLRGEGIGNNTFLPGDHRAIKRIVKPMMGFKAFSSASRTLIGIETMNMIRKGQVLSNKSVLFEVKFINQLFGIVS